MGIGALYINGDLNEMKCVLSKWQLFNGMDYYRMGTSVLRGAREVGKEALQTSKKNPTFVSLTCFVDDMWDILTYKIGGNYGI